VGFFSRTDSGQIHSSFNQGGKVIGISVNSRNGIARRAQIRKESRMTSRNTKTKKKKAFSEGSVQKKKTADWDLSTIQKYENEPEITPWGKRANGGGGCRARGQE